MAVVLLVTPAAAALCASGPARQCATMAHSCCDGPRLAQCNCDDHSQSRGQSEPAQHAAGLAVKHTQTALAFELPASTGFATRIGSRDAVRPPIDTSERLSRLATLLI